MTPTSELTGGAVLSPCGLYRYLLWRDLPQPQLFGEPTATFRLLFAMLNPSTADGEVNDPTIRRCAGFAAREAATSFAVVNLFAWRATDPAELVCVHDLGNDIVGPDNDETIRTAAAQADQIVVAWGGLGQRWSVRVAEVVGLLEVDPLSPVPRPLYAFGVTGHGEPKHPLYLPNVAPLTPWRLS
jgi:hypothetical protein